MAKALSVHDSWSALIDWRSEPHLVVGWTRNVNRWRDEAFFDLICNLRLAGRYALKRGFDEARGQYLLLAAFEQESDSRDLAKSIGAEPIERYGGYASQHGFKYGNKFDKALKATRRHGKTRKHRSDDLGGRPA